MDKVRTSRIIRDYAILAKGLGSTCKKPNPGMPREFISLHGMWKGRC